MPISSSSSFTGYTESGFGYDKQDQLQGEGFMQDNISYQKVSDQELDRVKKELKDQMNLENK